MSANDRPLQNTHFADDDTLDYISRLERDRARLVAALKMMREEYAKLPHSLGYSFTHLPKIDDLLRELGES